MLHFVLGARVGAVNTEDYPRFPKTITNYRVFLNPNMRLDLSNLQRRNYLEMIQKTRKFRLVFQIDALLS